MTIVIENAGAQRGVFLVEQHDQLLMVARRHAAHQASTDDASLPLESSDDVSPAIINYVKRTRESLVIDNAVTEELFASDPYILQHQPKSIVCLPVISQANLVGILYLENNLTTHAFTPLRLELLYVLASQMAIAWENAGLYTAMVHEIDEHRRTEAALHKALSDVAQLQEQLQAENVYLQQEIQSVHTFAEIIGHSQPLLEVLHQVDQVAPTETTVLILGETGTGKELMARAMHAAASARQRPLIRSTAPPFPTTLVESELFGHERGAFTGAIDSASAASSWPPAARSSWTRSVSMPLDVQAKLLRVLQEREFERVGGTKTTHGRCARHRRHQPRPGAAVAEETFRQDLYYRLNVFP